MVMLLQEYFARVLTERQPWPLTPGEGLKWIKCPLVFCTDYSMWRFQRGRKQPSWWSAKPHKHLSLTVTWFIIFLCLQPGSSPLLEYNNASYQSFDNWYLISGTDLWFPWQKIMECKVLLLNVSIMNVKYCYWLDQKEDRYPLHVTRSNENLS